MLRLLLLQIRPLLQIQLQPLSGPEQYCRLSCRRKLPVTLPSQAS